jgi:hypothetical protein
MLNIFPKQPCSGDIIVLKLQFYQSDGITPKDLTGITVGVTVKIAPDTDLTDAKAVFEKDIPGDTTGTITYQMGPFNYGTYWLDVKSWSGPQRSNVLSPTEFKVQQSVTNRATP